MKKFFYSLFSLALLFSATSCNEDTKELDVTPVLSASADLFVADGEDELVLTVMAGTIDVTADAKIYVDYQVIPSNVFTTTKAKEYKIFASYNGRNSNNITVKAANPALYVELPEDAQANKFDDFQHKVLLTQATGTWCGYCPAMIRSIELFQETSSKAANTVIVATHSGDGLSNPASEAVVQALKVEGFPSAFFSMNPYIIVANTGSYEVNAENIHTKARLELMEDALVGIAAVSETNADSSVVAVRAAIKVGQTGSYRVNAWLVEDSVKAVQQSYIADFPTGTIDHNFVLRAASCVSPIQGKLLGHKETCEQGEVLEFYHEFDAKDADVVNVANCKVVVLVSSTTGSKYYVNNIIECPVGESVPFAYND